MRSRGKKEVGAKSKRGKMNKEEEKKKNKNKVEESEFILRRPRPALIHIQFSKNLR